MNATARFFIGFAIAVVYPIFVYFAAMTVFPNVEAPSQMATFNETPPVQPDAPNYAQCGVDTTTATAAYRLCTSNVSLAYQSRRLAYEQALSAYDARRDAFDKREQAVAAEQAATERHRSLARETLALGLGIIGLAVIFIVAVRSVALGLGVGVLIVLLTSVSALLITGFTSEAGASDRSVIALVIGLTFGAMIGFGVVAERRLARRVTAIIPAVTAVPSRNVQPTLPTLGDSGSDAPIGADVAHNDAPAAPTVHGPAHHKAGAPEPARTEPVPARHATDVPKPGDQVEHLKYGRGIVATADDNLVTAVFEGAGLKLVTTSDAEWVKPHETKRSTQRP